MFDNLSERLERSFKILKGEGKITEINVAETLKDVRRALLDADVNYKVAKTFTDTVKQKALGQNVLTAVKPSQLMVKIVHDELATLMGSESVDLKLEHRPSVILMAGLNGAGKTTLLKRMAQELLSRKDLMVQYMPQNYEELLDLEATPVEFLDDSGDKDVRTRIRTYLGALKYTAEEMDHPIGSLSGGQKAKILLLKMSLSAANVLLLDEPTRNFSPLSGPVIRKMIASFPGAVISISHDRKYIKEVCTKTYQLTETGLRPL